MNNKQKIRNIIPNSNKKRKKINQDPRFDKLLHEFLSFRSKTSQQLLNDGKHLKELHSETRTLSISQLSLLDLLSDLTNIPKNIIIPRFLHYCDENSIIDSEGNAKGEIIVKPFNMREV